MSSNMFEICKSMYVDLKDCSVYHLLGLRNRGSRLRKGLVSNRHRPRLRLIWVYGLNHRRTVEHFLRKDH